MHDVLLLTDKNWQTIIIPYKNSNLLQRDIVHSREKEPF